MNEWSGTYVGLCALLGLGIWSARSRTPRPVWGRVTLWLACAALMSLVAWSVLACTAMPLWSTLGSPSSASEWAMCVAGSSFWAGAVIVFALPFYALMLAWYAMRFGEERGGSRSVVLRTAALGIPPAVALLYGEAMPPYGGVLAGLEKAFPIAVMGWVAATLGLALPRLLVPRLAPGLLVMRDAARPNSDEA